MIFGEKKVDYTLYNPGFFVIEEEKGWIEGKISRYYKTL